MVFIGVAALVGLVTLGFALPARPYHPHHEPSRPGGPQPFLPDLPEPVARHFHDTIGDSPPQISTAVVWGRARIYLRGIWLPARFKVWYRPGHSFFRAFELTFYTRPFLRGNDSFLQGRGLYEIGGEIETGESIDQDEALALWSEAVWMPSVFVHYHEIRWEPVDDFTARLIIPLKGIDPDCPDKLDEDAALLAHFDPETGCMTHLSTMRRRTCGSPKESWRSDLLAWKRFDGLLIPSRIAIAWGESGSPWCYWNVDGVAYNVDVSEKLR